MQRISRARGFSLVEMMVVASIVIVLLGMALPEMVDVASRYRLSGAARGIAGEIGLARMRAGAEFTQAHLMANTSAGTYWIEVCTTKNTSTGGCTTFTQEPQDGTYYLPPGITFSYGTITTPPPNTQSSIGQTTEIRFNSRGIPIDPTALTPTGNDALYLTSGVGSSGVAADGVGGQFYAVTVNASGKVSLFHYSGSAWTVM
jgi:Tfp pilus assembly protein FimT